MADNRTGLNAQYESPPFGLRGDYTHTGAPGSAVDRGPAEDDVGAGRITPPWGPSQDSARYPAATGGTVEPNQVVPNVIVAADESGLASTGAGGGHTDPWRRFDWQNPRGGE
jgi:hypothetical protein